MFSLLKEWLGHQPYLVISDEGIAVNGLLKKKLSTLRMLYALTQKK